MALIGTRNVIDDVQFMFIVVMLEVLPTKSWKDLFGLYAFLLMLYLSFGYGGPCIYGFGCLITINLDT